MKGLMIRAIARTINESFGNALQIITSDENADKQVRLTLFMAKRSTYSHQMTFAKRRAMSAATCTHTDSLDMLYRSSL